MSITTLDGMLAGDQQPRLFMKAGPTSATGRWVSYWGDTGMPGPGAWDNTLNGVTLTAPVNGQLPFTNPGAGNTHLRRLSIASTTSFSFVVADRLWHNGNISPTTTTAQSITSPTWPARDISGATAGDGVHVGLEVESAMGAASPSSATISYTNTAGTAGRTGTITFTASMSSAPTGAFYPFRLQSGDTGIKSVESITLGVSWVSGTCHLVAFRPIFAGGSALGSVVGSASRDFDFMEVGLSKMYNSSVPFLLSYSSSGSAMPIEGLFSVTQG